MSDYRTIAEAYLRALEFGLADIGEVAAWVDRVMLAEAQPAFAFIEASSAGGDPVALLSALRDVPGVADDGLRRCLVFGLMAQALDREPAAIELITHALYQMAMGGDAPAPDAQVRMERLDDALALARQGIYGREEDVRRELAQLLAEYGKAIQPGDAADRPSAGL